MKIYLHCFHMKLFPISHCIWVHLSCFAEAKWNAFFVCFKPWLCALHGYCLLHTRASFSPHRWLFYTGRNCSSERFWKVLKLVQACTASVCWARDLIWVCETLMAKPFPNCDHWCWIIDLTIVSTPNISFYVGKIFRVDFLAGAERGWKQDSSSLSLPPCFISFGFFFWSDYWFIVQAGLELMFILPLPLKC